MDALAYARIGTPEEAHGVNSREEYISLVHSTRAKAVFLLPKRTWPPVREVKNSITAFINYGRWIVTCDCNNCPSAHPDWKIACCLDCFVIYTNVEFPLDHSDIETILLERPYMKNRNWYPEETAIELIAENRVHGV